MTSHLARFAVVLMLVSPVGARQAPSADPLTVLSFNIRYGTANDGENRWEHRRAALFALMRVENADLVGLQEALYGQIQEIPVAARARVK